MGEPIELMHRFDPVDRATWRERVRQDLRGRGPEALHSRLVDGVEVAPLYVEADTPAPPLEPPGSPPFVRGSEPTRVCRVVHELAGRTREDLRRSAERALAGGADALHLPASGCAALRDAADLSRLLAGIETPITLDPGEHALAVAAAFERLEPPPTGGVVTDPYAVLARTGRLPMSLSRAMTQLAELIVASGERDRTHRPVRIDTRPYHEAGASVVDELGIALSSGVETLRALDERGLPPADVSRRMAFAFALDSELFVNIAKLRAARLLWSKVLRALGVDGPDHGMQIHASTSCRSLAALDPHVNLLRGTAAAFSAVVGGAEWVSVAPYDAPLGHPSAHAERLARNTQLLLRFEAHLDHVLDPAGGSYFVEHLTEDLARRSWGSFQELERLGGVGRLLVEGRLRTRIEPTREERRRAVATRVRGLVGVNRYPAPVDPRPRDSSFAGGACPDGGREEGSEASPASLDAIRALAAEPRGRLMEALMETLRATNVPFSELTEALSHGDEPVHAPKLEPFFEGADFERLRAEAANLDEAARAAAVVGVGDATALKARTDFAQEALAVAGLRVVVLPASRDSRALLEAFDGLDPVPSTVTISAPDSDYAALLPELSPRLRERGVHTVGIAGHPGDAEEALRQAGADYFLFSGMDAPRTLGDLLVRLGRNGGMS